MIPTRRAVPVRRSRSRRRLEEAFRVRGEGFAVRPVRGRQRERRGRRELRRREREEEESAWEE